MDAQEEPTSLSSTCLHLTLLFLVTFMMSTRMLERSAQYTLSICLPVGNSTHLSTLDARQSRLAPRAKWQGTEVETRIRSKSTPTPRFPIHVPLFVLFCFCGEGASCGLRAPKTLSASTRKRRRKRTPTSCASRPCRRCTISRVAWVTGLWQFEAPLDD